MKHTLTLIGPSILSFLILLCCSPRPSADLVLRGGRVYTLSASQPWAEALAIDGEILHAVGSNKDVDRFIGRDTIVVDLDGRLVLPGLNDCDVDLFKGSFDIGKALLDEARSIRDIQDIVLAHAEAHPQAPWIFGARWYVTRMDSERRPNRYDLDEVVSDRPVLIESHDGRSVLLNSKALQMAGIDRDGEPEGDGRIEKDPTTGEPTGLLCGDDVLARLRHGTLPPLSRRQQRDALRRGIAYIHRFGITAVHTDAGNVASSPYRLLEDLEERDELPLRIDTIFTVTKDTSDADLDVIERLQARHRGPWLASGGVRIELEGEVGTGTAAMLSAPKGDETTLTQAELDVLVEKLERRAIPVILRAIGDRAVRMALTALGKAANSGSTGARRHRLEGIDTISREDMLRLSSLGATACIQMSRASPEFVSSWARAHLTGAWMFKSLGASGIRLACGSRWPAFDLDPMVGIYTAVNRQTLDGSPEGGWNPDERLSPEQAIAAFTMGAAYSSSDEAVRGSLEGGKLADLVVLSEDLFRIPRRRIAEIEAVLTIVGGRTVYVSPGFVSTEMRARLLAL